jgi:hypothetical protein
MSANGNQGFGRRRPPERKSVAAGDATDGPGSGGRAGWSGGGGLVGAPLAGQFGGIMFGLGILLCMGLGYVAMMKGFGRALDQHWRENVGFPGVEDAYKRIAGADVSLERVHNDCKSRSDFVRLDKRQRDALEGFDGLYAGESALATAAFYVSCLTAHPPERLCQPAHRAHLIAALKDYYKLMGKVREERMMSISSPFAAERMALMSGPRRELPPTTPPPSAQTDERVVNGLRPLITGGYLARRDLEPVLGPPGDLDVALRGVEPRRAGCG